MNFHDGEPALARIVLLSVILLMVSANTLAGGETSEKPEDWDKRLEMFRAVPYISFSEEMADENQTGVVIYDPEKAYDGYNLYCTKLRGEGLLLDMEGQLVHRWVSAPVGGLGRYQHVAMVENGDLLVIRESYALLRFNWDSELVWRSKLAAHHDVAQAPDGTFYVLVSERRTHRGMSVIFDAIVHLTEDGEEIDRWSTYDHLEDIKGILDTRSFLDTILDSTLGGRSQQGEGWSELKRTIAAIRYRFDYFHTNTVTVLPATPLGEKDSRFRQGNLLVCFRNVNQIAVLEKDTYRILWFWGEGELDRPHHPTLLEDGHILIFDNGTQRKFSRVLELDPTEEIIVWEYMAEPPEDFHSGLAGSSQRLPNGNTLICESTKGRTFEVTRGGEVVWTWVNPMTSKKRRGVVYRMIRLPSTQIERLLKR